MNEPVQGTGQVVGGDAADGLHLRRVDHSVEALPQFYRVVDYEDAAEYPKPLRAGRLMVIACLAKVAAPAV